MSFNGHVRNISWSYDKFVREGTIAAAYYQAKGVSIKLIDSKAEGDYITSSSRP